MPTYRGFSWPLRFDNGGLRFSELSARSSELLDESLKKVVLTPLRTRPRRRDWGAGLIETTFKNLSTSNPGLVAKFATEAIAKFEPRATVESVRVTQPDDGVVVIDISYSRRGGDDTQTATFTLD